MNPADVWFLAWVWTMSGMGAFLVIIFMGFVMGKFISVLGAKSLAINFLPNRRAELIKLDDSELAHNKKRGYFLVNPDHVYIESKSGKPIMLASSLLGKSVSPEKIKYIESLKGMGINNISDLERLIDSDGMVTVTVLEKTKDEKGKEVEKPVEKKIPATEIMAHFGSQSIPVKDLVDYFAEQMPGDLQESKIQHRVTVEAKKQTKKDYAMWVVLLAIIMVAGALAVVIVSKATGGGAIDPNALTSAIESGIAKTQTKVILQNMSTATALR